MVKLRALLTHTTHTHTHTHTHAQGELSPERLYSLAEERLGGLRDKLSWRERRWREVGDYRFLQTWLLSVRGVSLEEPLKMAKQPIGI